MIASAEETARMWERQAGRHWGKYRGIVSDSNDPKNLGRIRARVPEILGDVVSGWALPAAPYSGDGMGVYLIPEAGTGVWIEFEAGDVSRPIWSGCWWGDGKLPKTQTGKAAVPGIKILRTKEGLILALNDQDTSIAVSDKDGRNLLDIKAQQGQISVRAATKVVVEAPQIELVEAGTHPLVFGDQLVQYLNQLANLYQTHMHPGETAAGVPVSPAPPVPPFPPATPALLSVKVKTG